MKREDVEAISIGHAGSDEAALRESKQDQTVGHDVWARNVAPRDRGGRARPRRTFRANYKLAIIEEYEACSETGERGALLRREGLYSSIIADWRRQKREGVLVVDDGRRPAGRGNGVSQAEVEQLRRKIRRLEAQLAKQEAVIEVQGKVQELLEQLSKSEDNEQL